MNKKIILLIILFLAIGAGFLLGFANREVEVVVRSQDSQGNPVDSFVLRGGELASGNFIDDLLGGNFAKQLPQLPWYITRASAVTAYLLMFVIVVIGAGMTTGYIYNLMNPVEAWSIHKNLSLSLGVTILIHITSLMFDKYINFSLIDLLVPFASKIKPLYVSLGIFAFYLILIAILTSLLIRLRLPNLWRKLHYLVYPIFALSALHGLLTGSDSKTMAMQVIYITTASIFVLIIGYRSVFHYLRARA